MEEKCHTIRWESWAMRAIYWLRRYLNSNPFGQISEQVLHILKLLSKQNRAWTSSHYKLSITYAIDGSHYALSKSFWLVLCNIGTEPSMPPIQISFQVLIWDHYMRLVRIESHCIWMKRGIFFTPLSHRTIFHRIIIKWRESLIDNMTPNA